MFWIPTHTFMNFLSTKFIIVFVSEEKGIVGLEKVTLTWRI